MVLLDRFSIMGKMLAVIILVDLLLGGAIGYAVFGMQSVRTHLSANVQRLNPSAMALMDAATKLNAADDMGAYAITAATIPLRTSYLDRFHSFMTNIYQDLKQSAILTDNPDDKQQIETLSGKMQAYQRDDENAIKLLLTGDKRGAYTSYFATAPDELTRAVATMASARRAMMTKDENLSLELLQNIIGWSIVLALLAFICGTGLALLVSHGLSTKVRRTADQLDSIVNEDLQDLAKSLEELSRGNLTATFRSHREQVPVVGNDEVTHLVRTYNLLAENLQAIAEKYQVTITTLGRTIRRISDIGDSAATVSDEVADATLRSNAAVEEVSRTTANVAQNVRTQAKELLQSSESLQGLASATAQVATGTKDQASSLQSTNSSVRTLNEKISRTSEIANSLSENAVLSSHEAESGAQAVEATQIAMQRMRDETEEAIAAVGTLAERSEAVESIIVTIEEIADQTNLLALNAAIEAARAGEHGRGFAVVADEVRKLAERASASTREIGSILTAIRKEITRVEECMQHSSITTEDALHLATNASEALAKLRIAMAEQNAAAGEVAEKAESMRDESTVVARNISSISAIVEESAVTVDLMNETSHTINDGIETVSITARENSDATEQLAAASLELAAQMTQIHNKTEKLNHESRELKELLGQFVLN